MVKRRNGSNFPALRAELTPDIGVGRAPYSKSGPLSGDGSPLGEPGGNLGFALGLFAAGFHLRGRVQRDHVRARHV